MKEALAGSCNPYFISLLCEQQDAERLLSLAKSLGLFEGREFYSGFSVPSGSYPTKIYNEIPAFLGNLAIGQGEILASPLGVAQMTNTVANNGIYVPLNLFSSIVNDNLNDIESLKREEKVRVIDEADAKKVQAMLSTVVSDGTGSGAKIEGLSIAGKTSSAETGWKKKDGTLMVQGWFSGFFPAEKPKYQITRSRAVFGGAGQVNIDRKIKADIIFIVS